MDNKEAVEVAKETVRETPIREEKVALQTLIQLAEKVESGLEGLEYILKTYYFVKWKDEDECVGRIANEIRKLMGVEE